MYGVIYKITNKVNGKPYIGQTKRTPEKRFIDHIHCKTSVIGKAIDKYKPHNFTLEIVEADVPDEKLNEREIFWIAFFNSMVPNGYNVAGGGQGNWERTPESIAKMSRKGKHHRKESKAKISAALMGENNPNYGKTKTDEEKAKLSAATKNKRPVICVETGETFESMSAAARAKQSTVQDISRACKNPGRTVSGCHWRVADEPQAEIPATPTEKNPDEARAKMPNAKIGSPLSDEHKATISASVQTKKPVICVETGVIYESITEASRANNIKHANIKRACHIPSRRAGGYHWRFKDEQPAESQIPAGVPTPKHTVICVETNEIFESISSAARSKNLRVTNISRACHNPRNTAGGCHWRFVEESAETPTPAENVDAQASDNETEKI